MSTGVNELEVGICIQWFAQCTALHNCESFHQPCGFCGNSSHSIFCKAVGGALLYWFTRLKSTLIVE